MKKSGKKWRAEFENEKETRIKQEININLLKEVRRRRKMERRGKRSEVCQGVSEEEKEEKE